MAKDPAFLFYYQDFLVGTHFMSYEEIGAYVRILCHQADKGKLSEGEIKEICGPVGFTSKIVSKFEKDGSGLYYNERLRLEVNKRKSFCKSRRLSRLSALRTNNVRHTYDRRMEDENENENIVFKYLINEAFKKAFDDYLTMRQRIRKPATKRAKELVLAELHKHDMATAIAMLERSILNSWQGVFPLKESSKKDSATIRREKLKKDLEEIDADGNIQKGDGLNFRSLPETRV